MTDFNFRALCAELVSELFGYKVANPMHDRSLVNRACAELDETRGTGASAEQVAQIVYENAMLATAPDHAKPHWPSWADLPNSDARAHALNTAEIIYALLGYTMAPDHVSLIDFAFKREPWATWLRKGGCLESAHCELVDLMTAVLSRWGRPAASAVKPIPLSERLPEDADCLVSKYGSRYCWLGVEVMHGGRALLVWNWKLFPLTIEQQDCLLYYWLPASTRFLPTTVDPAQLT
jgi:hypothetical protein